MESTPRIGGHRPYGAAEPLVTPLRGYTLSEQSDSSSDLSDTTECSTSTHSINKYPGEEDPKDGGEAADCLTATIKGLMKRYPNKVPVKVKYGNNVPKKHQFYKTKYMVTDSIPIGTFITLLRMKYMEIPSSKAIFCLISDKYMVTPSELMGEVYNKYKSENVLYLSISMESVFGSDP